jgi:hypothetical protein
MKTKQPMSEEQKAHLRWWIVMSIMCGLLLALNYKRLPHIFSDVAKPALVIAAWGTWTKAFADLYHRFVQRRPFAEWQFLVLAGAIGCSLLLWALNDNLREVLGILYFSAASAAVILIVFRPDKKQ